jgi:hypothetical protein
MTASSQYLGAIVVERQVQLSAQGLLQFELLQTRQLAPVLKPTGTQYSKVQYSTVIVRGDPKPQH